MLVRTCVRGGAVHATPLAGRALAQAEPRFTPLNTKYATAAVVGRDGRDWVDVARAWQPEQTEACVEILGKIFQDYFDEVNAICPLEKLRAALYDIRDKKRTQIEDGYAAEMLLDTVCRTTDKFRGVSTAERTVRQGNGWEVSKDTLRGFFFDIHYPFVLKQDITERDLKVAKKVREVLLARPEVQRKTGYWEADLIVLCVLAYYKPQFWRELRERICGLPHFPHLVIHPATLDLLLEAVLARYNQCKELQTEAYLQNDTRTHAQLADELASLSLCFYAFPGWCQMSVNKTVVTKAHPRGDLQLRVYRAMMARILEVAPSRLHVSLLTESKEMMILAGPALFFPIITRVMDALRTLKQPKGRQGDPQWRDAMNSAMHDASDVIRALTSSGDDFFTAGAWQTDEGVAAAHAILDVLANNGSRLVFAHQKLGGVDQSAGCWKLAFRMFRLLGATPAGLSFESGTAAPFLNAWVQAKNSPRVPAVDEQEVQLFFEALVLRPDIPPSNLAAWTPLLSASYSTAPLPLHNELIQRFVAALADPMSAAFAHSELDGFMVSQDPFNLLLSKARSIEQATQLIFHMRQQKKAITRSNYLTLFSTFFENDAYEEAVDVLWRQAGQHEPADTRDCLVMCVAHAMCTVAHLSKRPELAAEAEVLLNTNLFDWSQKSLPMDNTQLQYRRARPVFQKVLPKVVTRLDQLMARV